MGGYLYMKNKFKVGDMVRLKNIKDDYRHADRLDFLYGMKQCIGVDTKVSSIYDGIIEIEICPINFGYDQNWFDLVNGWNKITI